jgi:hypothetical protein
MAGAAIAIDDAAAADTILSVKQRVFVANRKLFVRRQRLVYSAGPRGMDALADDETLGGAGVARDGTAELDVLVADLTAAEAAELGEKVFSSFRRKSEPLSCLDDSVVSTTKVAIISQLRKLLLILFYCTVAVFLGFGILMSHCLNETSCWKPRRMAARMISSRWWPRAPTTNAKIGYAACALL